MSAKRADQALKVRLKLAAEPGVTVDLRSPYFEYKDVYLFDPVEQAQVSAAQGQRGHLPGARRSPSGGRRRQLHPDWGKTILMSLTFQAPPDDVTSVDLVLPDFLPFEGVAIEGLGGAAAGGIAAAGKTLGLEGALKELKAEVTPQEIKIDLSADVLFDFDKADHQERSRAELQNLATVLKANPDAR